MVGKQITAQFITIYGATM